MLRGRAKISVHRTEFKLVLVESRSLYAPSKLATYPEGAAPAHARMHTGANAHTHACAHAHIYICTHVHKACTGYTNMGFNCFKGVETHSKCCSTAWKKCPCRNKEWKNMGCHCHKDAHSFSFGKCMTCPSGYFHSKITLRRHKKCPNGTGPHAVGS